MKVNEHAAYSRGVWEGRFEGFLLGLLVAALAVAVFVEDFAAWMTSATPS